MALLGFQLSFLYFDRLNFFWWFDDLDLFNNRFLNFNFFDLFDLGHWFRRLFFHRLLSCSKEIEIFRNLWSLDLRWFLNNLNFLLSYETHLTLKVGLLLILEPLVLIDRVIDGAHIWSRDLSLGFNVEVYSCWICPTFDSLEKAEVCKNAGGCSTHSGGAMYINFETILVDHFV